MIYQLDRFLENPRSMNVNKSEFSKLLEACDHLSNEEKAKLLKHLIGNDTGLSVSVGGSQFCANTVYQVNLTDKEQVSDVLRLIANIIEKDVVDSES